MIEDLIFKFCDAQGVSGDEAKVLRSASDVMSSYGETFVDRNNNLISKVAVCGKESKSLMLDAHIDQVGLIVIQINERGFIKVSSCGGIDPLIMIGSTVVVHGKEDVIGVVCSTPPHLQKEKNDDKHLDVEDLYVDVGFEGEDLNSLISLGDIVTFKSSCRRLLNGRMASAAMDNRASVVSLIRAVDLVKDVLNKLECNVTVVFSAQEETTGRGCLTSTYSIAPEEAIVVDVSFASQPNVPEHKTGVMGKGPMIGVSPVLSSSMTEKLISLAKSNNIPYQLEVMSGKTGTNADKISSSKCGIKTALLSIPIRYMHTPVEMVDVVDIENTAKLISCYIKYLGGC